MSRPNAQFRIEIVFHDGTVYEVGAEADDDGVYRLDPDFPESEDPVVIIRHMMSMLEEDMVQHEILDMEVPRFFLAHSREGLPNTLRPGDFVVIGNEGFLIASGLGGTGNVFVPLASVEEEDE